jgi:uncharacterized membrane protein (TIGR02234 family)
VTPARRELGGAVVGAALAGALALVAGGQSWARVTVTRAEPLPPVESTLSGAEAAPLVAACGLVLLAAAVALLAVRAVGRVAVGLLVATAGAVLAWSGLRAVVAGVPVDGVRGAVGEIAVDTLATWPGLAAAAGVLGVAVGLFVVLRGRAWPAMGRRYERRPDAAATRTTGSAPLSDEDRAQAAWKALDRGEDPTA